MKTLSVHEDANIDIDKLKTIEQKAYEDTIYSQMQSFRDIYDLAEYCEVPPENIHVLSGNDWYVILGEHEDYIEIVDMASTGHNLPVNKVLSFMKSFNKEDEPESGESLNEARGKVKPFTMDARETTSYKLVKALDKADMLRIDKDEEYIWGNEKFHDIECEVER